MFNISFDAGLQLYVRRRLNWIFRTEKINAIAFRALELAIIQNLLNEGKKPDEISMYVQELGRYFGDLLYIGYHARGGEIARNVMDIGRIANSFYIYLFGESLDNIYYIIKDGEDTIELHLVAKNGFPTCRDIVSPYKDIKFGAFIVGAVNRMLELKSSELEYSYSICREEKCIATGDECCELVIEFKLQSEVVERLKGEYGGEYNVR